MFSASCHYGLQAMFYIACHSSQKKNVELSEIAAEQNIPKHFLSKILQSMVKQKLLVSMKGPTGGFKLSRPADSIHIVDVVEAIDGLDIFTQCGIEHKECDENDPCPIHDEYHRIREEVFHLFKTKTLETMAEDLRNGNSLADLVKPPPQKSK
ncbi:RrF2 family transcriptional regulator [Rhodohalobacter sp.]|uniref:RrF2 family transcriptional regulator n=1 Tax=Rhodohalobacter sp. TaxID=1974210 RepID=UPI00356A942D